MNHLSQGWWYKHLEKSYVGIMGPQLLLPGLQSLLPSRAQLFPLWPTPCHAIYFFPLLSGLNAVWGLQKKRSVTTCHSSCFAHCFPVSSVLETWKYFITPGHNHQEFEVRKCTPLPHSTKCLSSLSHKTYHRNCNSGVAVFLIQHFLLFLVLAFPTQECLRLITSPLPWKPSTTSMMSAAFFVLENIRASPGP